MEKDFDEVDELNLQKIIRLKAELECFREERTAMEQRLAEQEVQIARLKAELKEYKEFSPEEIARVARIAQEAKFGSPSIRRFVQEKAGPPSW